jgi:hypothetical protein
MKLVLLQDSVRLRTQRDNANAWVKESKLKVQ